MSTDNWIISIAEDMTLQEIAEQNWALVVNVPDVGRMIWAKSFQKAELPVFTFREILGIRKHFPNNAKQVLKDLYEIKAVFGNAVATGYHPIPAHPA